MVKMHINHKKYLLRISQCGRTFTDRASFTQKQGVIENDAFPSPQVWELDAKLIFDFESAHKRSLIPTLSSNHSCLSIILFPVGNSASPDLGLRLLAASPQ